MSAKESGEKRFPMGGGVIIIPELLSELNEDSVAIVDLNKHPAAALFLPELMIGDKILVSPESIADNLERVVSSAEVLEIDNEKRTIKLKILD